MLSDKEVMNAAEAITRAYLTSLFSPPPTGARARTSQKHSFHFLSLIVQGQQVPLLPHGTAVGDEMQTLRGRCSELLRYDAQALHVLCCVVNMVQEGLLCTERDVYYRNTELFPNGQRDTHCSIERLCRWMSCVCPLPPASSAGERRRYTREDLRIGASGKSILLGNLAFDIPTVSATSTSLVSGGAQELPTCVPSAKVPSVEVNAKHHISGVLVSTTLGLHAHNFRAAGAGRGNGVTAALVVVEKESTLHTLADVKSALGSESISDRCAYLCSKGYPCRASRLFLRSLHRELPELPILVLVDGDPHGLRIALTFMGLFGEDINRGRRCQPAERVPELSTSVVAALLPIRWVGVRPSCLSHDNKGRAPLTEHDRRVLKQVIQRAKAALEGLPGTGSSFPLGQYCVGGGSAEDIIRVTLDEMLREAEWMQMMETKCCLQAYVEGPLRLIIDFLHR
ncbi:Type IIB DNA topoisomerase, putative [Trypanosoma equiperdum]|uniref:DNA topoisomerase (ATP-hydrolyzing) n=3 Tax=Trypanozoon TaxID=39700 RepID=Q38AP1_TRYB2|nr:hypothetical protein, conserved [Trypanosoma brucei brucei TREU927]EAN78129.1 hypothetical protein, conserved [Trypanosoma brucei brucei TREU927]SCU72589.1 Type IIB DNA topoisomerase, putative [Trypanosoma equiperdum]